MKTSPPPSRPRAAYRLADGTYRRWPARQPVAAPTSLAGVPIRRCDGCGVRFVSTIRDCPWCGVRRRAVARTACVRGHPLIGANVGLLAGGGRYCLTCSRLGVARPRRAA